MGLIFGERDEKQVVVIKKTEEGYVYAEDEFQKALNGPAIIFDPRGGLAARTKAILNDMMHQKF